MAKKDTYYKIDETKPKNALLLKLLKEHCDGVVSELARRCGVHKATISSALNKKKISLEAMIKIARYFSTQLERIEGIKQMGQKPHNSDLLKFESPSFSVPKKRAIFPTERSKSCKSTSFRRGLVATIRYPCFLKVFTASLELF